MNKKQDVIFLRSQTMNDNKSGIFRATVSELEAEININDQETKGKRKPMRAQAIRLSSAMKNQLTTSHFNSGIACLIVAFALWTSVRMLPEVLGNFSIPAIKLVLDTTTILLAVSAFGSALRIVKINQITYKEI